MTNLLKPTPSTILMSLCFLAITLGGGLSVAMGQQVQVTAANPPSAEQGTINLDVKVTGKGFKNGAKAKWFVTGTTNPGGVTVNSTTFVSSTELTANITVSDTATLANFDIQVLNSDGRGGKGTELFAVLAKSNSGRVQVNLADPSSITQGWSAYTVRVYGMSFDSGAQGKFLVSGTSSTGGIVVNSTTFVDESRLLVNITATDSAVVGNFDIQVTNSDGRIGLGTALFTVNEKKWGTASCPLLPRPTSDTSGWIGSGGLDYAFDFEGLVRTVIREGRSQSVQHLVIQPDGKIVGAGFLNNIDLGTSTDFVLLRYNTDGSLDTTFGDVDPTNSLQRLGYTVTDFPIGGAEQVNSVVLQTDGKIIVGGSSSSYPTSGTGKWAVARYTSEGTLDSTFGTGGRLMINTGASAMVNSMVVQSDGKIVLVGEPNFTVVRLLTNGSLDPTFGSGGITTFSPVVAHGSNTDTRSRAIAVAIQRMPAMTGEERIVVGGWAVAYGFGLMRFRPDGTIDTSFGNSGRVLTSFYGSTGDQARDLAIDSSNRIVVSGLVYSSNCYSGMEFGLARYTTNGTLDLTFSGDGKVSRNVYGGQSAPSGLALQSDGKIVITGTSYYPNAEPIYDFTLMRFNSNGAPDDTFGPGWYGPGVVTTEFPGYPSNWIYSVVIQGDGKLVAGGVVGGGIGLARYTP